MPRLGQTHAHTHILLNAAVNVFRQVQQQMQSQISDLRDKLTDACAFIFRADLCSLSWMVVCCCSVSSATWQKTRYTEIANMKKTKSQFEQEVG